MSSPRLLLPLSFLLVSLFAGCETTSRRMVLAGGEMRDHHYVFAHQYLPTAFYQHPMELADAFDRDGESLLRELWLDAANGLSTALPAEGLDLEVGYYSPSFSIYYITLPTAEAVPEAYFTALVYDGFDQYYLTLEKSFGTLKAEGTGTMLCAWSPEAAHLSFGPGPEPTLEAFQEAVLRWLDRDALADAVAHPNKSDA